jgi:ribonuclease P protein component
VQVVPLSELVEQRVARDFQLKLIDQRLLKTSLLRKGWEFEKVYSKGKRLHGSGYTLICLDNGSAVSRLGVSVHRKIRGAVKRNRIKRIIRESFRLDRKQYPQGADIVFAVRSDFSCKHPGDICKAVEEITARFTCGQSR